MNGIALSASSKNANREGARACWMRFRRFSGDHSATHNIKSQFALANICRCASILCHLDFSFALQNADLDAALEHGNVRHG